MKKWNEKYHDKLKRHSLSGQLGDMRNLSKAWKKVKANRGSEGVDGESIERFEARLEQNLVEIQRLLKENRYKPSPVKRVYIPKTGTKHKRPLGVPTIRDRVVQQVLKNLLEPIFEEIFLLCSHGYRPGKNAHQAVRKAQGYFRHGYDWVVDADIQGFFDHVDHQILMDLVREKVADGRILDLVEAFLKSGVMKDRGYEETVEGTPQGGVISPLLANIYLNHLDRRMGEEGFLLLRYADDFLIFCKSEWEANKALSTAKQILEKELRLTPHPEKTKIVFAMWKGVEYLGFRFTDRWCSPKENSIKKFKDAIRRRTRRCQPKKLQTIVDGINPVIRGWGRYFGHGTVKECYRHLDGWIRGRIRCFKAKKRCKRVIMYTLPKNVLQQMGLVTLSSLRTR